MEAPPSAGVRVRSGLVRFTAATAAITAYLVSDFLVYADTSLDLHHGIGRWLWNIVPWLLGLPVMRRLSMAPSAWLVIVLVPFGSFWLVGRLVDRLVALPARDWPPAWWEIDRMIPLSRPGLWFLAPDPDLPARIRLAPPSDSSLRRRVLWASRNLWPFAFGGCALMVLLGEAVTWWIAIPTIVAVFLVVLTPEFAFRAAARASERRVSA